MRKVYGIIAVLIAIALIIGVAAINLLNTNPPDAPQTSTTPTQPPNQTPTESTLTPTPTATMNPPQTTYHGVPLYSYNIANMYPHDPSAFTEGLVAEENGVLLESTGLNGESSLRRVNLTDGSILQKFDLPTEYFGEGITVVGDKIVQLTYISQIGFVYDKTTFELLGNFSLNTEGWGLTFDGTHLIMSDGSSNLYFLNPNTYQTVSSITVHDANGPVDNLNELEFINGTIYANMWFSSKIALINPATGQIEAYIDLVELAKPYITNDANAVLNGIAYNPQTNQLFVTGKNWSSLYEIQLQKTQ